MSIKNISIVTILIIAAMVFTIIWAGGVEAQESGSTAQSGSTSGASAGVYVEGNEAQPKVTGQIGVMLNSHANWDCASVILGFPGADNHTCTVLREAQAIAALAGPQVAIQHLCLHDDSMATTLNATGQCTVHSHKPSAVLGTSQATPGALVECVRRSDGSLLVKVKAGATNAQKEEAAAVCRTRTGG